MKVEITDNQKKEILHMWQNGHSRSQIAIKFKVTEVELIEAMKTYNLTEKGLVSGIKPYKMLAC